MSTHYLVKSPRTGNWFRYPGGGSDPRITEAFCYAADHPDLADMVSIAQRHGAKLILRQVPGQLQHDLESVFEREIEATPCVEYIDCPDCEGEQPLECDMRQGEGRIRA